MGKRRRVLKKKARKAFLGNYWHAVAVCLVLAFVVGSYSSSYRAPSTEVVVRQGRITFEPNSQSLQAFLTNILPVEQTLERLQETQTQRGIMAALFNNITRTGSFVFGILNALNQFIFGETALSGVLVLAGTAILFLLWLLVASPLEVGASRFFLESAYCDDTKASRLFSLYQTRRWLHPAKVMFLRGLYNILWAFTIVGGVIKLYAWRMVPYILAENPDIRTKDALAISARMMKGNKWRAFVLDLSFIGWDILSYLTFGILAYAFVNPYKAATEAQLYLELRTAMAPADAERVAPNGTTRLAPDAPPLPVFLYPVPDAGTGALAAGNYLVHYRPVNVVLIFFTFCMIGWVWEVVVDLFQHGVFVNRGTLYGPWLPIYGVGGTGVVLLFHRLGRRPLLTFGCVFVFCGVMEFLTSWVLERLFNQRWWDYTGYFLNINGRVCLEGLLVFALGGCAAIYFLAPALNSLFERVPQKGRRAVGTALLCLFLADMAVSAMRPNTAALAHEQDPPRAIQSDAQTGE